MATMKDLSPGGKYYKPPQGVTIVRADGTVVKRIMTKKGAVDTVISKPTTPTTTEQTQTPKYTIIQDKSKIPYVPTPFKPSPPGIQQNVTVDGITGSINTTTGEFVSNDGTIKKSATNYTITHQPEIIQQKKPNIPTQPQEPTLIQKLGVGLPVALINTSPLPFEISPEGEGKFTLDKYNPLSAPSRLANVFTNTEKATESYIKKQSPETTNLVTGLSLTGAGAIGIGLTPVVTAGAGIIPGVATLVGGSTAVTLGANEPIAQTITTGRKINKTAVNLSYDEELIGFSEGVKYRENILVGRDSTGLGLKNIPFVGSPDAILGNFPLTTGVIPIFGGDSSTLIQEGSKRYYKSLGYSDQEATAKAEEAYLRRGYAGTASELTGIVAAGVAGEGTGQILMNNPTNKINAITGLTNKQKGILVENAARTRLGFAGALEAPILYSGQQISRGQEITPEGVGGSIIFGGVGAGYFGGKIAKWSYTNKFKSKAGLGAVYATNIDEPFGDFGYSILAKNTLLPNSSNVKVITPTPSISFTPTTNSTPSASSTPTATSNITIVPTSSTTDTSTIVPSPTTTETITITPTPTPTSTSTITPTETITITPTPTPTSTTTFTPTSTITPTITGGIPFFPMGAIGGGGGGRGNKFGVKNVTKFKSLFSTQPIISTSKKSRLFPTKKRVSVVKQANNGFFSTQKTKLTNGNNSFFPKTNTTPKSINGFFSQNKRSTKLKFNNLLGNSKKLRLI
jgi:hypothetical protein